MCQCKENVIGQRCDQCQVSVIEFIGVSNKFILHELSRKIITVYMRIHLRVADHVHVIRVDHIRHNVISILVNAFVEKE